MGLVGLFVCTIILQIPFVCVTGAALENPVRPSKRLKRGRRSGAVSVAGGWWVAAVGFVVVLQRYRSCGSWACPGGLVSGWTWCWGRIWGYLAGWI